MKKISRFIPVTASLLFIILLLLSAGCTESGDSIQKQAVAQGVPPSIDQLPDITLVELYHFHGHQQCYSCIVLGDLAEEVVNTYYADELASGKLIFAHVNAQAPENSELASKYEVYASSLMIGIYTEDSFTKQDLVGAWYRIGDKDQYAKYLTGILNPFLRGE